MAFSKFGQRSAQHVSTLLVSKKKRKQRKGPLSKGEQEMIANLAADVPNEKQINAAAIALRRNPKTIASAILEARETIASRAGFYADIHKRAVEQALEINEPDTARKGAMEMLDRISAKDAKGEIVRVLEKESNAAENVPRIQIGIALGGLPTTVKVNDEGNI